MDELVELRRKLLGSLDTLFEKNAERSAPRAHATLFIEELIDEPEVVSDVSADALSPAPAHSDEVSSSKVMKDDSRVFSEGKKPRYGGVHLQDPFFQASLSFAAAQSYSRKGQFDKACEKYAEGVALLSDEPLDLVQSKYLTPLMVEYGAVLELAGEVEQAVRIRSRYAHFLFRRREYAAAARFFDGAVSSAQSCGVSSSLDETYAARAHELAGTEVDVDVAEVLSVEEIIAEAAGISDAEFAEADGDD